MFKVLQVDIISVSEYIKWQNGESIRGRMVSSVVKIYKV